MGRVQKMTLAALMSLLTLSLAGCGKPAQQAAASKPPAPQVDVAAAVQQRLVDWDAFTGRLEAPDTVEVKPRVSGYIEAVAFEEGTQVEKGQLLFRIDARPFQAEVARLDASLASARSAQQLAEQELQRARKLRVGSAISQEQLDARLAQQTNAQAQVAAAQAALQAARLNLEFTEVRAAISGRVSRALVTAGNYVTAGQTALTSLVSTDKVYAYFDADEQTYLKYRAQRRAAAKAGTATALIQTSQPMALLGLVNEDGYPHQGLIDFVDNRIDPQTGTIRARAVFSNAAGLFTPGLFARIKMVGSAEYDAVLIQDSAVGTDLSNKFVLVMNPDTKALDYRPVQLGEKVQGLRIVKSGLKADELIVVKGLQRVRSGATVNPQQVDMADAKTLAAIAREAALALQPQVAQQPEVAAQADAGKGKIAPLVVPAG